MKNENGYSTPEAAKILGISASYMRKLIADGEVATVRLLPGRTRGRHRIPESEIARLRGG